MEYKELEVGEVKDDFIIRELIDSYKERIKLLEDTVRILRNKYEPFSLLTPLELGSIIPEKYNPTPQRPRLTSMSQVIKELEKRTSINPGVTSEEVTESK